MENRNIQSLGSSNQSNHIQSLEQKKYKSVSSDVIESKNNSDKATLSAEAQVLSKSLSELGNVSDVRTDKVAALKEQVDSRTYEIKYQNVAARIEQLLHQISD
jgi:anti-sigma28 factor (negative regulator of flagellin synthesis)